MASVKNLKRDLNFVFADIIEAVYVWQLTNPSKDTSASEEIIDEAITSFDEAMVTLNAKNVDNKKVHFKTLINSVHVKAQGLIDKVNNL